MSIKKVFLSSTARDLAEYRELVYRAIEGLDGYHCVRMEDFGARDWEADAFCRAKVAECDLFVGIVGHLYGSCPPGTEQSYTEREYEAAVAAEVPRLMFIAPEDFRLPANLREPGAKWQRQRAFRDRISQECIRETFSALPEDLAWRVVQAIRNWEQEQAVAQRHPFLDESFVRPLIHEERINVRTILRAGVLGATIAYLEKTHPHLPIKSGFHTALLGGEWAEEIETVLNEIFQGIEGGTPNDKVGLRRRDC
jgi:hypothetical protein